jgi:hypothetical protein
MEPTIASAEGTRPIEYEARVLDQVDIEALLTIPASP